MVFLVYEFEENYYVVDSLYNATAYGNLGQLNGDYS